MSDSRINRAFLSVVVLIFCTFTAAKADLFSFFECFNGKRLRGHGTYESIYHPVSLEQCLQKCLEGSSYVREGECLSITYYTRQRQCAMMTDNRSTVDPSYSDLDEYRDAQYCEMKDILSFFLIRPGYMQAGHDDAIVSPGIVNPRVCALRCLLGEGDVPAGFCLSFDIESTRPDSCRLSKETPATTGLPLLANHRFNYYQRNIDPCFHSSCVHGYCTSQGARPTCVCDAGWGEDTCDTVCDLGTFGPGCAETCHCATGMTVCDVQSGECSIGGCATGWSGPNCQTACPSGHFGLGCTGTCHCASGDSVCETETGVCTSGGCMAGWQGSNCQTRDYCTPNPCVNGDCANQANGYSCACHAGWQGADCDAACTAGTFGLGCAETCHCAGGIAVCDKQSGACSSGGCAAGWSGPNCQTACPSGHFGPGCTGTCHCASGGSVCEVITGACTGGGCMAGWQGSNCQEACDPGVFGTGCSSTCHCANGGSVCDHQTGVCTGGGCAAGWKGRDCQTVCSPGEFGPGCTGTCHCASGDSACDIITGVCTSGGCMAGWQGSNCQDDIDECSTNTGNCHINATCTNTEGSFSCSCYPGFQGDGISCTATAEHPEVAYVTTWAIVAIVLGLILVVGIVAISCCFCRGYIQSTCHWSCGD